MTNGCRDATGEIQWKRKRGEAGQVANRGDGFGGCEGDGRKSIENWGGEVGVRKGKAGDRAATPWDWRGAIGTREEENCCTYFICCIRWWISCYIHCVVLYSILRGYYCCDWCATDGALIGELLMHLILSPCINRFGRFKSWPLILIVIYIR